MDWLGVHPDLTLAWIWSVTMKITPPTDVTYHDICVPFCNVPFYNCAVLWHVPFYDYVPWVTEPFCNILYYLVIHHCVTCRFKTYRYVTCRFVTHHNVSAPRDRVKMNDFALGCLFHGGHSPFQARRPGDGWYRDRQRYTGILGI